MLVKCKCGRARPRMKACVCGQKPQGKRQTAAERGYNYKWQKYRERFLASNPLCVHCEARGETSPATEIDHIKRPPTPQHELFWDYENHQGLCKPCHDRKSQEERRC